MPSPLSLTRRQRELLAFIQDRIEKTELAPSFDEMCAHLGLRSKSGIHRLIGGLQERGHIIRMANRSRAIALPSPEVVLSPALSAELRRRFISTSAIEMRIREALGIGSLA